VEFANIFLLTAQLKWFSACQTSFYSIKTGLGGMDAGNCAIHPHIPLAWERDKSVFFLTERL